MDRLLDATYRAEREHFWFRGFRRFVQPLLARAANGRRDLKLLDCGCGTGANMVMLAEYGRVYGFDLTWSGLQYAHKYGQRRLAHASVIQIPFASAAFDVATSFDVLYCLHDEDEAAAVAEIFRVLRRGGRLIVNVAALQMLRGNHSIFGQEVRRSTRRRLRRVLGRAGFEIERITYTNATLFPLILAARTAQRLMGLASPEEAGTDIALPPAPVNAALSGVLALEGLALHYVDMPIGSSLLCLARKP